jgi:chromosome segregation ATPase
MQQLEDHAESLKDALEYNKDGQLDALKNVVRAAEIELESYEASFEDAKIAVAALMENLKNLRREVKEKVAKLAALRQSCNVAREEKERVEDKRHRIISDKNAAIARVNDDKRHRDRIREKHDQLVTRILELTEQASIITERVPVDEGETTDSLATKLDRLKRDLQRYSDQYVVPVRLEPTMLISNYFQAGRFQRANCQRRFCSGDQVQTRVETGARDDYAGPGTSTDSNASFWVLIACRYSRIR